MKHNQLKEYRITVAHHDKTRWTFRFQGNLNWWQRFCAKLAGFEVKEIL